MKKEYESNKKEVVKALEKAKNKTLNAIGLFVVSETTVRAPYKTGNLRGSYSHTVDTDKGKVTIGTPVDYALFVEKGTSKQSEQPHLTPAVEENLRRIEALTKELMKID